MVQNGARVVYRREEVTFSRASTTSSPSDSRRASSSKPIFSSPVQKTPDTPWFEDKPRCMSPDLPEVVSTLALW